MHVEVQAGLPASTANKGRPYLFISYLDLAPGFSYTRLAMQGLGEVSMKQMRGLLTHATQHHSDKGERENEGMSGVGRGREGGAAAWTPRAS